MALHVLTPPGAEPVSLEAARAFLRRSGTEDDALIGDLIASARASIEAATGLALITQSWRETLDVWPRARLSACGQAVRLARAPLISIEAVRVRDVNGALTVWDPAEYRVEPGEPGRLIATLPFTLPQPDRAPGGIEIDFTAGFGATAESVPAALREAILHQLAAGYGADRGEGASPVEPPDIVARLIAPYRRVRL